jgi:hypothetical protein
MSQGLLDRDSWRRAINPAVKVIGYTAAIYLVLYLLVIVPATFLVSGFGAPESLLTNFISPLVTLAALFGFIASFFKVLDEQRPGQVPLKMS